MQHGAPIRRERLGGPVEFLDERLDEIDFGAPEPRREQLVEFAHALARLLGSVDIAIHEFEKLPGERLRDLHTPAQDNPGYVLRQICNHILHEHEFEQVLGQLDQEFPLGGKEPLLDELSLESHRRAAQANRCDDHSGVL